MHHPFRFAQETALLQARSKGRLEIQLAIGYCCREATMFGINFRIRGRNVKPFPSLFSPLADAILQPGTFRLVPASEQGVSCS
jgi:hypothetical protein